MNPSLPRGFSLIELMMALAIAGILLVFAMPGYGVWLADSEIKNGAQSLADGLRFAQAEAIKRNESVQVVVDKTTGTGGWSAQQTDGTPIQAGTFQQGAQRLAFAVTPVGRTTVTFDGLGRVAAANTDATLPFRSILVTNATITGSRPLQVMVGNSVTGVKLCDPAFTAPDPKACP